MNKKNAIWSIVLILLVVITIATINLTSGYSLGEFIDYVNNADIRWLVAALIFLVMYISFEGLAILVLAKAFGHKRKFSDGLLFSTSDIYFSAITPSATGGQPASAMFMVRSKIPMAVTTIVLLVNLSLFTTSLISFGIICLLFNMDMLLGFGFISKLLIIIGFLLQFILTATFLLLVYKEKIVIKCADWIINILTKLHLMKHGENKREKLMRLEVQYKECASLVLQHKKHLLLAFLCNLVQRFSLAMISVCVGFSVGVPVGRFFDLLSAQIFVMLGSNSVPIPGAVGATDYIFIDGYGSLVGDTVGMELLSRGISFYVCIILCAVLTLILGLRQKMKER